MSQTITLATTPDPQDTLLGGAYDGTTTINGGINANRLTLSGLQSGTYINLAENGASAVPGEQGDSLTLTNTGNNRVVIANIETVTGASGGDTIEIGGITANMRLDLGGGDDAITITAAATTLRVTGVESISGGAGGDVVTFDQAVNITTANAIDLGGGTDRVNLANGGNTIRLTAVESVIGGTGNDVVSLGSAQNTGFISLGGGTGDVLNLAATGNNTLTASGVETINGGGGNDFITLNGAATLLTVSGVTLDGAGGDDRVTTTGNFNRLTLTNVESVVGGTGADSVTFTDNLNGANVNLGLGLADYVQLANGNDVATIAAETILGGADTADVGNDVVTGAAAAANWLVNLGAGSDQLNLFASSVGSNTVRVLGVEVVSIAGAAATADVVTFLDATTGATTVTLGAGNDRVVLHGTSVANAIVNTLSVDDKIETVQGGLSGQDVVTVTAASTGGVYQLGLGNDTLDLFDGGANTVRVSGVESLSGGDGDDSVSYLLAGTGLRVDLQDGDDTITLTNSGNSITVLNVETVNGASGIDTVTMGTTVDGGLVDLNGGLDRLTLADGGNALRVEEVDTLTGGVGFDSVAITNNVSGTMFVTGVEKITGGAANDFIILGARADNDITIDLGGQTTGAGDKVTLFNATTNGNSIVVLGTETVLGGSGGDSVSVDGSAAYVDLGVNPAGKGDRLSAVDGAELDVLVLGAESIVGGAGVDAVTLGNTGNTVNISGVENVTGGTGADRVTFSTAITDTTVIKLGGGSDVLTLSSFSDHLVVYSDSGIEVAFGGAGLGVDTVSFAADVNTSVTLGGFEVIDGAGATGNNRVTLSAVRDSAEVVDLGAGSDRLVLAAGDNDVTVQNIELVVGNTGADTISVEGAVGAAVRGGAGNDSLSGGDGRDQLTGGAGSDTLTGGDGADMFRFALNDSPATTPPAAEGRDSITDFEVGVDLLVFTGLLRGEFTWQGTAALGVTNESQARWDAATSTLQVDADGNGVSELQIVMSNGAGANLSQSDFLWT